jgi:hypothetical protein
MDHKTSERFLCEEQRSEGGEEGRDGDTGVKKDIIVTRTRLTSFYEVVQS